MLLSRQWFDIRKTRKSKDVFVVKYSFIAYVNWKMLCWGIVEKIMMMSQFSSFVRLNVNVKLFLTSRKSHQSCKKRHFFFHISWFKFSSLIRYLLFSSSTNIAITKFFLIVVCLAWWLQELKYRRLNHVGTEIISFYTEDFKSQKQKHNEKDKSLNIERNFRITI